MGCKVYGMSRKGDGLPGWRRWEEIKVCGVEKSVEIIDNYPFLLL